MRGEFDLNRPKPVQPMAPAAVEVDLGVGAGAAAGELEAGWRGQRSTEVSAPLHHGHNSWSRALRSIQASLKAVNPAHLAVASSPRQWSW